MKKSRIIIDLEPHLKEWLEKYAEGHYMSRNNVISEAVTMYKKSKEVNTVTKVSYQVIEDNGGGLHLAVLNGDDCIYFASGFEHYTDTSLQNNMTAVKMGIDPLASGWEGEEDPQGTYNDMTSHEYGWEIIADSDGVYPDKMGVSGKREFNIKEEE